MSDSRDLVPTKTLVRHGTVGIGGIVGGGVLLILGSLGGPWAFILGGVLAVGGAIVAASSAEDRVAGGVVAGAGILTVLSGIGFGVGGALLSLGGIGLIAAGAVGAYRFLKGLRARR